MLNRFRSLLLGVLVALSLPAMPSRADEVDPLLGSWELNVAKSSYVPGPAPKSERRTYVLVGKEIKASSKGVAADGTPISQEWTVNYDGQDRPQLGSEDASLLSIKRIDAHTAEFTEKKDGKVVITGTRVISKDGKTMTTTTQGVTASGEPLRQRIIFEKRS